MTVTEMNLKGVFLIEPKVFEDSRGYFFESYNARAFAEAGLKLKFVQDNQSKSQKNVLRGLHFQKPPAAQGKLVQVISGAVLDVAVDIRSDSPTYGQHVAVELSSANKKMMYISEGFAHGFLTLENETIFTYKCTDFYNHQAEASLLWNDRNLGINWGVENPILSPKDMAAQSFEEFQSPF